MGNLGGGEVLVILMLGLLVLGPHRLRVVIQQLGRLVTQIRRFAASFQEEFREIVDDPSLEAAARIRGEALQEALSPETPNSSMAAKSESDEDAEDGLEPGADTVG
ncbi:MAG: hypothetical protein CL467_09525 [Acidimicrobiaceae bacterium]|nr:hypothetical protein [Acidimicrobiaceae bacterium]|tara:strand:- start:1600 stop:1917 length:318 start_codon:yes stop_codon:yes gene_type:complete